jgi:hypothetical protein
MQDTLYSSSFASHANVLVLERAFCLEAVLVTLYLVSLSDAHAQTDAFCQQQ